MKKILIIFILIMAIFTLSNCGEENIQTYSLTLLNHESFLLNTLKSRYSAGEKVEVETTILYDASLDLYLNEEKIEQTYADTPNWHYEFIMPALDSVLDFRVKDGFLFTISIHDYISFPKFSFPSEYFKCQFYDISEEEMFSTNYYKMIGYDLTDYHYEYEMIADTKNYKGSDIIVADNKEIAEDTFITERYYHYGTNEDTVYQFIQIKNEASYCLNETDNVFTASVGTISGLSYAVSVMPNQINLLNLDTQEINYKKGTKADLTLYYISGVYTIPDSAIYSLANTEVIYVFEDDNIIAFYYKEIATSLTEEGYWQTTKFCIPKNDEILLLDEEELIEIVNYLKVD